MNNTLYLTADEQKLFDALSEELKEGWELVDEVQDSYESPKVIAMRAGMASFDVYPELEDLAKKVQEGEDISKLSILNIPEQALGEFAFTIGAKGLSAFIEHLSKEIQSNEDILGLAVLTLLRHEILETNASISYS